MTLDPKADRAGSEWGGPSGGERFGTGRWNPSHWSEIGQVCEVSQASVALRKQA